MLFFPSCTAFQDADAFIQTLFRAPRKAAMPGRPRMQMDYELWQAGRRARKLKVKRMVPA
ncbi:MAG: hypothetical protein A3J27_06020 [Candidatus Tectomicrobia bacterium RIFCSPLOWO2_12_FULL_69_37]|nr:MAG: hypothetical protein A3J27_06020 [Candidatus Tectomicrobia bacterium RIFCSPLOWO2_12_FULL_69_37]